MKILNKIKMAVAMIFMAAGVIGVGAFVPAMAVGGICETGSTAGQWTEDVSSCTDSNKKLENTFAKIINLLLGVIGVLAVIMIIWSGFKYVTSAGDPGKIKQARTALIYSVVGLIVAILAFGIVNFATKILG